MRSASLAPLARRIAGPVIVALAVLAGTAAAQPVAQPAADAAIRRVILAAEAAFESSFVRRDLAALDTLYAADFEWRHWDGTRDTRRSWLAFLADSVTYHQHAAQPETIDIFAHAVLVTGRLTSRGRYLGESEDFDYTLRYARLWVEDDGRWRVRAQLSHALDTAEPASIGVEPGSEAMSINVPAPAADLHTAALLERARTFMESYARDLRAGDGASVAARYHPDGAYLMGAGRKRFVTHDSIRAIYTGSWEPPAGFEWHDLAYEAIGADAVLVAGRFLWQEAGGRTIAYSYSAVLQQHAGQLRIRLEDESAAPDG